MNFLIKKKTKRKKSGLLAIIDRFMMLSVLIPPGYILYRFVRWYVNQDNAALDDEGDEDI